jgi:hypothetical protein
MGGEGELVRWQALVRFIEFLVVTGAATTSEPPLCLGQDGL